MRIVITQDHTSFMTDEDWDLIRYIISGYSVYEDPEYRDISSTQPGNTFSMWTTGQVELTFWKQSLKEFYSDLPSLEELHAPWLKNTKLLYTGLCFSDNYSEEMAHRTITPIWLSYTKVSDGHYIQNYEYWHD